MESWKLIMLKCCRFPFDQGKCSLWPKKTRHCLPELLGSSTAEFSVQISVSDVFSIISVAEMMDPLQVCQDNPTDQREPPRLLWLQGGLSLLAVGLLLLLTSWLSTSVKHNVEEPTCMMISLPSEKLFHGIGVGTLGVCHGIPFV